MNRVKATKRNILMGYINTISNTLFPFILRTVMIYTLGGEFLGLNGLFTSILQVLNLADLGFGNAIVSLMYKPVAERNNSEISSLLNTYKKIYSKVGWIILLGGILISPFIQHLIDGSYPTDVNVYIVFLFFVVNTVVSYWFGAYKQSLLLAHQRIDRISISSLFFNILMYGVQIFCLLIFKDYYSYIVWLPIITIAKNVYLSYVVGRYYPQIKCFGEISKEIKDSIKKKTLGLMVNRICDVCRNSFDSIILSMFLGLVVLAEYQNYYTIMIAVASLMQVVSSSIIPSVGNSIVLESVEKNLSDFSIWGFLYMKITGVCTSIMICMYQPFIRIWIGEEYLLPFACVIVFGVYFYVLKIGDVCFVYKEAMGMWWLEKKRCVLESVVNLLLNIVLVKHTGIFGVLLSTILAVTFINIPWSIHILFKNFFGISSKQYYKDQIAYALDTAITVVVAYSICSFIREGNILNVIGRLFISALVSTICMFLLSRRRRMYRAALDFIKNYINRKGS